jgi:low affinity Fe/Cu permease
MERLYRLFDNFSKLVEWAIGTPWALIIAIASIIIWAASGPFFDYSDSWQLVINSSTTVLTWLMLFLLQSTQNRGNLALHVKLDELLRAVGNARTSVALAEELERPELDALHEELREEAQRDKEQHRD